jgi:hypothetical protein
MSFTRKLVTGDPKDYEIALGEDTFVFLEIDDGTDINKKPKYTAITTLLFQDPDNAV